MGIIRPPRLAPGATVRLIAPSGPVPEADLHAGLPALQARYKLKFDPATLLRANGFLAGTDEERLADLHAAIADPEASAVMMARGGHGLLRLLPGLDLDLLRRNPKPLIGFSDGTALLAAAARAGVASVHGPVVTQLQRLDAADLPRFFGLLESPGPAVLMDELESVIPGRVQGPLIGGNLEVFSRLLGTPFLPDPSGAILFFEDIGERPYRVDRLLTHLDLAGIFSVAAAVIVGEFTDCNEPATSRLRSPSVSEILEDRLSRLAIPVVLGAPFGHGTRNVALPYGTLAELDTRYGTLTALEGAVT